MPISEAYSGAKDVSATEWSLTNNSSSVGSVTTDGVYQFFIDLSDMVSGDILEIRVYEKARSGDTQRLIYNTSFTGTMVDPLWASPSLILMHGWDATVNATVGTINVTWSIRQVA
jgi:hypothetical protein